MKIFFVIDYKIGGRGGLERVLTDISLSLMKRQVEILIILTESSDDPQWENKLPIAYIYNSPTGWENYQTTYQSDFLIKLIESEGEPDYFVTLSPSATKLARELVEKKRLFTTVVSWLHFSPQGLWNWEMVRYAHGHLCISSGLMRDLQQETPNIPCKIVHNPVNLGSKIIPRPTTDKVEFLFIGRLYNPQKRVDLFFNALSKLKSAWGLTIIGEGQNEKELKELANQLNINERITWMGWKDDPWLYVNHTSVLVLTSEYEGFGLVLAEALSRGIPVISSNCNSGPADIIQQGINGWLFKPNNQLELSQILQQIADKSRTLPEAAVCLSSVSHFSSDMVVQKFEEALLEFTRTQNSKYYT